MLCTFLILQLEVPLRFPMKLALKCITVDFNKGSLVPNVACSLQISSTGSAFFYVQLVKVHLFKLSLETSIRWNPVWVRASSWLHPLVFKMWCKHYMQRQSSGSCSFVQVPENSCCACWCTLKLTSDVVNPSYMIIIIIAPAELLCLFTLM